MANPVLDKFFQERFGGQNPFTGAQLGGPQAGAGQLPGGLVNSGLGGIQKPQAPAGEPPWVTKAREARKAAKAGAGGQPPISKPESMPAPSTGEIVDPWGGPNNVPAPTGPYNPGPRPTPSGAPPPLMGGIPRGGIMGGQGIPKMPQPPPLQRNPQGPPPLPAPPKAPRDSGAVFGKTPGGGF